MSGAKSSTATATTGTADREGANTPASAALGYTGRFAPTPSGDLHLGSLYTAVAGYLDARAHRGRWILRIEDLDGPREVPGSTARILATLEAFGFEWDGEVVRQSGRLDLYASALDALRARNLLYECSCSRLQLADEDHYPGSCRTGPANPALPTATRLRVDPGSIFFADIVQGSFRQDLSLAVGDFILKRRDHIFAYVLAVVVDDAAQGVTHVVRGADLLDNTPRQIYLQRALGLPTPAYAHVPVLIEPDGSKLAKFKRSVRLDPDSAVPQLTLILDLLGLAPPPGLSQASLAESWRWATEHWDIGHVPRRLSLPAPCL